MTGGQLLREARLRHGLTQKQLGMRVGTTQSAISRIERDQVSPTVETLETLLAQLNEELVLETREVPWGIDVTLFEETLRMTPEQRIAAATAWGRFVLRAGGPRAVQREFDPLPLLRALVKHRVDFVMVGGLAGTLHGSARVTRDLDVAYSRDRPNLVRLAALLLSAHATLRGARPGLPFQLDADTLAPGANFTFTTDFGAFNILGDPSGAPDYDVLRREATAVDIDDISLRIASLDHLIRMKEAAGRPQDRIDAAEYRALSDELRRRPTA